MNIGMLWYDDDTRRTLEQKLTRAADYYQSKYGQRPTTCLVNQESLPAGKDSLVAGLRLQAARTILLNHFWLGVETDCERNSPTEKCPNCGKPIEDGKIFCDDCAFLDYRDGNPIAKKR